MFTRSFFSLIAGLVAGLLISNECFAQSYAGLGVSSFSLHSEYSSVDGRSATGFTMFAGLKLVPTWDAELSVSAASGMIHAFY